MSKVQLLLKTQKNEVLQILREVNLEPADFSWVEAPSFMTNDLVVSRLNYRDGRFYYQFDYYFDKYRSVEWCEFSPGDSKAVQREPPGSWQLQLGYATHWAGFLKKEIDAPDLWQEIEKYRASFSLIPPEKLLNEPIPAYEAEEIGKALSLLATQIEEEFKLNSQQNQFVNSKLEYLAEAAKRQGRLDWVHTTIGVIITIAFALAMAPDQTNKLWLLMKNFLGQFIHLIGQ